MEPWHKPGRQTSIRDIEFVEISAKSGCLDADLERKPIDTLLIMMAINQKKAQTASLDIMQIIGQWLCL